MFSRAFSLQATIAWGELIVACFQADRFLWRLTYSRIFMSLSDIYAINSQQQADRCLLRGDFTEAVSFYEEAIANEPGIKSHYWHLGLVLLLQGKEAEAQTTWLLATKAL